MSELREVIGALQSEAEFEAGGANWMSFHETFRRDNDMHMIDLLASGVAHDFNNRLQSIASALSLLRVRIAAGCTSDLGSLIEVAERSRRLCPKATTMAKSMFPYASLILDAALPPTSWKRYSNHSLRRSHRVLEQAWTSNDTPFC